MNIETAKKLASEGASLRKIAKELNVSHEWVRLKLDEARFGSEKREEFKQAKKDAMLASRKAAALAAANERPPCRVCGGILLRWRKDGKTVTCSHECAVAWATLRTHTQEGRAAHRLAIAKSTLKKPETRSEIEIRWAQRALSGEARTRKGWYVAGSKTEEVAKKYGWA